MFLVNLAGYDKDVIVFATEENLDCLQACGVWFADGTFDAVPSVFYQLYTIHGLVDDNECVPLVYMLLKSKDSDLYEKSLRILKRKRPNMCPNIVMVDFEPGPIKSFSKVFSKAKMKGCSFHFNQCFWRHIQLAGLSRKYNTDVKFNTNVKLLKALAFVPVDDVRYAYEKILATKYYEAHSQQFDCMLTYMEKTWIGEKQRNNTWTKPRYDISLWNHYNSTLQDLPRTTNACEGWHNRFNTIVARIHPSFFRFLSVLQNEQSYSETRLTKIAAKLATKVNRRAADPLRKVVQSYKKRSIITYLRNVVIHT